MGRLKQIYTIDDTLSDNRRLRDECIARNTKTKGNQEKSLKDALAFASEYMKSSEFAKEWEKFCKTNFGE
jgi:hypothetical protein